MTAFNSGATSVLATSRRQTMSIPLSRTLLAAILFVIPLAAASAQESGGSAAPATAAQDMPDWFKRGLPGPGHAALEPLVGLWRVHFEIHGSLGRSPNDAPLVSDDVFCRREWVAGGRYIEDTTEGTIEGGPYWRRGWLGYSNMDRRYEWVTIDATNSTMMTYVGERGSGNQRPIDMKGEFTDQGVAGEAAVGKRVPMRTEIRIDDNDHHTIDLYFTPPGKSEVLATRAVYTRLGK
ncbi:MAG: DUF1579 domain-containing protein [Mesorhizobium sp.]|nr:MAG: DUF1579 domain-containing protein [Mesorhizobium sp.]TIV00729.1 MAG: DUF1579 domain-containing protein [Mesorhizobium sp.]TIX07415.1 MAG: DUF1579 domain-containing protein [Mesorhizobium sp.]